VILVQLTKKYQLSIINYTCTAGLSAKLII